MDIFHLSVQQHEHIQRLRIACSSRLPKSSNWISCSLIAFLTSVGWTESVLPLVLDIQLSGRVFDELLPLRLFFLPLDRVVSSAGSMHAFIVSLQIFILFVSWFS